MNHVDLDLANVKFESITDDTLVPENNTLDVSFVDQICMVEGADIGKLSDCVPESFSMQVFSDVEWEEDTTGFWGLSVSQADVSHSAPRVSAACNSSISHDNLLQESEMLSSNFQHVSEEYATPVVEVIPNNASQMNELTNSVMSLSNFQLLTNEFIFPAEDVVIPQIHGCHDAGVLDNGGTSKLTNMEMSHSNFQPLPKDSIFPADDVSPLQLHGCHVARVLDKARVSQVVDEAHRLPVDSGEYVSAVAQNCGKNNCSICQVSNILTGVANLEVSDIIRMHTLVHESGVHNFQKCKIVIPSRINVDYFRVMLAEYSDSIICDLLEFGCPIGYIGSTGCTTLTRNHKGAVEYEADIQKYLEKEASYGAIIGPFASSPFVTPIMISALNSVPKRDSVERRVILDLSFPKGNAINDSVDKDLYLGEAVNLKFPTTDSFVKLIKEKGVGCLLFKCDLRRAYRQIPIDPGDVHLIGFHWKGHMFVDRVLPMGLRSSAHICQRVTDAVRYMASVLEVMILNYIDDLAGAEVSSKAHYAFSTLRTILQNCGLEESMEKAAAPSHRMIFLGIMFDTVEMSLEIDEERISEILLLLSVWCSKEFVTLKELRSLLGKLHFISSCVRPGRIFVSRLLNWLRDTVWDGKVRLPNFVRKDLLWWSEFLVTYNGVSMMMVESWSCPDEVVACDACLTGCGGISAGEFFHCIFPEFIQCQSLSINCLEMLGVIICLKLWGDKLKGKRILLNCDNKVSVTVINSGRTRNNFLQACLREICFLAAMHEFDVRAEHIEGVTNRVPDLLSRWDTNTAASANFRDWNALHCLSESVVDVNLFYFSHDW